MTNQEARDDELIVELRGFAEGSTSARASLMRDAADAIERLRKHPEPEWEQGWAPHAYSRVKFPTEGEARNAYYMAAEPVRLWRHQKAGPWLPVSDSVSEKGER